MSKYEHNRVESADYNLSVDAAILKPDTDQMPLK